MIIGEKGRKMSTSDSGKSKRGKEPTPRDVQKNGQNAISQEDPTLELNQLGTGNHANDLPEPSYNVASLTDQQVAILCDVGDGRKTSRGTGSFLVALSKVDLLRSTKKAPLQITSFPPKPNKSWLNAGWG